MLIKEDTTSPQWQRPALHAIAFGIMGGIVATLFLTMVVFGYIQLSQTQWDVGNTIVALAGSPLLALVGGGVGYFFMKKKRSWRFIWLWFPLVLFGIGLLLYIIFSLLYFVLGMPSPFWNGSFGDVFPVILSSTNMLLFLVVLSLWACD